MATSWSKLTTHSEAARRAGGRRRINAVRHWGVIQRRAKVFKTVSERGLAGFNRGVRAQIARELGVSRSTISRDVAAIFFAPRELPAEMTNAAVIRLLSSTGARLGEGCECPEKEREREPWHSLGHALQFAAETLDGVEEGRISLSEEQVRSFEVVRDKVIEMIDWVA